jgi:multiple sugar transport system substrate-binding protein
MCRPQRARRAAAVVGLSALIATVAGCGSSTSGSGGPTTVTFDYLWTGKEAQALQRIIADFNASQKKVVVKGVSAPDAQKQLASMSSSAGAFDISDNFGNAVGSWAAKGVLEPLNGYLSANHVATDDFIPAALDQMTYQGKIYSLPIAVHDFQLIYNKKEFAEAGIAQPPKTTGELATDIAKLTKTDGKGNITQLGLGNPDSFTTFTTLGYAFGGAWDAPSGPQPTTPGNLAALNFYQQNVTKKFGADKIDKFTAGWGPYMSPQDPFYTGKVAMVIDGEWQAVGIPANASKLEWGVTSVPVPADQAGALTGTTQLTASTLFIPRNAKHKKEAFTFLEYLTGKDAMAEFSLALGNLPGRKSLLDDPRYRAVPQFSFWADGLKGSNVHALASKPYSATYSADLTSGFDAVRRGTKTPEQAMASIADKAKQYDRS